MTRLRGWLLHRARPRDLDELMELLPDAAFESVPPRHEVVICTGWDVDEHGAFVAMGEDA